MSIVSVVDAWPGSPLRVVVRVAADDEDEAVELAKTEVRAAGYTVKTRGWVGRSQLVDLGSPPPDPRSWDVLLFVREAA